MKTVRKLAAMKAPVAPADRGERRARPQTPWPLVQPLLTVVPKPTSKPPRTRVGSWVEMTDTVSG